MTVQVLIPKFAAAFVGTGDLFTALSTAWLARGGGDLKLALEKTVGTMQVGGGGVHCAAPCIVI